MLYLLMLQLLLDSTAAAVMHAQTPAAWPARVVQLGLLLGFSLPAGELLGAGSFGRVYRAR